MASLHPEHVERQHTLGVLAVVGIIAAIAIFMMLSGGEQAGRAASMPRNDCTARAYCEGSTRILLQQDCNQVAIPCESGCAGGECIARQTCAPVKRCESDTAVTVTSDCRHAAAECGAGRCRSGLCI